MRSSTQQNVRFITISSPSFSLSSNHTSEYSTSQNAPLTHQGEWCDGDLPLLRGCPQAAGGQGAAAAGCGVPPGRQPPVVRARAPVVVAVAHRRVVWWWQSGRPPPLRKEMRHNGKRWMPEFCREKARANESGGGDADSQIFYRDRPLGKKKLFPKEEAMEQSNTICECHEEN